jgi:hypothetical protein
MRKIGLKSIGILVVTAFSMALTSCGGSSGGGETEIDFEQKDLINKVWYSNPYLSKDYENDDALIVYRFESGGMLTRQQYSGKRDNNVGTWSLVADKLEINDNSVQGSTTQEWFIQSGSTTDLLKLNSSSGRREYRTSIMDFEDVTADAFIVNDLRLVDGVYKADFRIDYEVYGKDLDEVTAMLSSTKEEELIEAKDYNNDKIFVLSDEGLDRYLDGFEEEQIVRFYLKTEGDVKFKLDEDLSEDKLDELDYTKVEFVKTVGSTDVTIDWKSLDENDVYYIIEILSSESNSEPVLFRSYLQPAESGAEKSLEISQRIGAEIPLDVNNMIIGENYFIRISGIQYEDSIDPINSSNKRYNIQAKTVFTYKITW